MTTPLPPPGLLALDLQAQGFKVYEIEGTVRPAPVRGRRDFYKIVLVAGGEMTLHVGEQAIAAHGTFLFLANPHVPHAVTAHTPAGQRFACLFTEAFIAGRQRTELLHDSPLHRLDSPPVIPLSPEQAGFMTSLFQQMLAVYRGDYAHRNELLRTCLELVLHEALLIQPAPQGSQPKTAATRLTQLFLELLERQFPIESTARPLQARTAQDFAGRLAVHVNYLNRAVKEVTGKPTSVHIAERVAAEAKALLQHTDWSVADIAYGLGFDYPTYFNNFFKRVTGRIPKAFRTAQV